MKLRERHDDERERGQPPSGASAGGADLDAVGQAAERLLAAGDAAIDRALSKNSDAFLAACRQLGGQ